MLSCKDPEVKPTRATATEGPGSSFGPIYFFNSRVALQTEIAGRISLIWSVDLDEETLTD